MVEQVNVSLFIKLLTSHRLIEVFQYLHIKSSDTSVEYSIMHRYLCCWFQVELLNSSGYLH